MSASRVTMRASDRSRVSDPRRACRRATFGGLPSAFTLIELLFVVAVIALVAAILLPALGNARARAYAVGGLNNVRQLSLALQLYATDQSELYPYNFRGQASRSAQNWANNLLSWGLDSDNTNAARLTATAFGAYVERNPLVYRCPADTTVSPAQQQAGWSARVRSYSMNASVGDAGDATARGFHQTNPEYVQFFKPSMMPRPADVFVFVDEHPDSTDDGHFLNQASLDQWLDLPASYHNGAAEFAFADGHSVLHRWQHDRTKAPPRPGAAKVARGLLKRETGDYDWVIARMSTRRD